MSLNRRIVGIFFALVLISGCTPSEDLSEKNLKVVASFYPLAYLTQEIAGDAFLVETLIPAGVEPHDYEPSTQNVQDLYDADLVVYQGSGFELWIEDLKSNVSDETVQFLEASSLVELRPANADLVEDEEDHSASPRRDPHSWLDPVLMQNVVNGIVAKLSELAPENKDQFELNAKTLNDQLAVLDQAFSRGLSNCEKDTVVVSHNAFSYLAARYGFLIKSIAGLSPDDEPSLNELVELQDFIAENDVQVVFMETLASPEIAETLANEAGLTVLTLNPLEGLTVEEIADGKNYFTVMEENLKNLQLAMACEL